MRGRVEACVEDERRSGACRAREEEWHSRMHAHTHKCTPTHARARTAPSLARKDGGQETQESVTCWSDGFVARESSLKFPCPACDKNEMFKSVRNT